MLRSNKMRMPNPQDFDSDIDYEDACEAYRAYLNGKTHLAQPSAIRFQLAHTDPDSNYFAYG